MILASGSPKRMPRSKINQAQGVGVSVWNDERLPDPDAVMRGSSQCLSAASAREGVAVAALSGGLTVA